MQLKNGLRKNSGERILHNNSRQYETLWETVHKQMKDLYDKNVNLSKKEVEEDMRSGKISLDHGSVEFT